MEATKEKKGSQKQSFFYHHSCHGQTTLHNLLVDNDRPQKYIIHKYRFVALLINTVLPNVLYRSADWKVLDEYAVYLHELDAI